MKELEQLCTYECSGTPKPFFKIKAEFTFFMKNNGFKKSTLTKNTDMLIVEFKGKGTLKEKKAEKYGIPIYTYNEAINKVKNMATEIEKFNL